MSWKRESIDSAPEAGRLVISSPIPGRHSTVAACWCECADIAVRIADVHDRAGALIPTSGGSPFQPGSGSNGAR